MWVFYGFFLQDFQKYEQYFIFSQGDESQQRKRGKNNYVT